MGLTGGGGFSLSDVITSMYEVDTFSQNLNAPLTYNYNTYIYICQGVKVGFVCSFWPFLAKHLCFLSEESSFLIAR